MIKTQNPIQVGLALCALAVGLSSATPAKADSFTYTGAMITPHVYHTATLLPNGNVLVVGGINDKNEVLSSTEIYNPGTRTWTPAGSSSKPRIYHTATLLSNGKVLIVGGNITEGGGSLTSADIYDPAAGTWTPTGSLAIGRYFHSAILLPSGKVLAIGGDNIYEHDPIMGGAYLTSVEVYDPETGTWAFTGRMSIARIRYTPILLPGGNVLVAGGSCLCDLTLRAAELYNPATELWTATGSMSTMRDGHITTLLADGRVLVAGGGYTTSCSGPFNNTSSAELYDSSAGTWTATSSMSTPRTCATAIQLPNGKVLVAGGHPEGYPDDGTTSLSTAEAYDPTAGTWNPTSPMNTARNLHTATLLLDGRVLIVGGANGTNILSSAEIFNTVLPLKIKTQPASQLGYWGKPVSFSVNATNGIPPYTYQWLKDGVAISDATNSILVLTNLQATNAGAFSVVVSDSTGASTNSTPANLTVRPAGVNIALYPGVTIDGVVGQTYGIQMTTNLANTNSWAGLTNITLTVPTQLWYDSQAATKPERYYRVLPGPISIP